MSSQFTLSLVDRSGLFIDLPIIAMCAWFCESWQALFSVASHLRPNLLTLVIAGYVRYRLSSRAKSSIAYHRTLSLVSPVVAGDIWYRLSSHTMFGTARHDTLYLASPVVAGYVWTRLPSSIGGAHCSIACLRGLCSLWIIF